MTPDVTVAIRPASGDDIGTMAAMIERAIRLANAADYDPETIERICANFTPDRIAGKMAERDVFCALKDGALVGTVSLGKGKLHSMFVDPGLHRRGIGALLVRHLERHAARQGLTELRLSSSLTARGFYARLGYVELAFEPHPDGSTYLMSKPLGAAR